MLSLSITSLRFIHAVAYLSRIPFLSKDEYYSLCGYITLCLSIHLYPSVSGHLGSFCLLAIVSNAAVNMSVHFFFFSKTKTGTSLVIQWLRLQAPNAGGPSSTPHQGPRSHILQLNVCVQQQKDPACCNWDHAVCQVASVVSYSLWPCGPPGSSVHGILRQEHWSGLLCLLSRESSRPRDQTCISHLLLWQAGSLPPAPPGS